MNEQKISCLDLSLENPVKILIHLWLIVSIGGFCYGFIKISESG